MLFPPTEREAVLAEVRAAMMAACDETEVPKTEADPFPGFLWRTEIMAILDRLARAKA